GDLIPGLVEHRRVPGGWRSYLHTHDDRVCEDASMEGVLVDRAQCPRQWPSPSAILEASLGYGTRGSLEELRPERLGGHPTTLQQGGMCWRPFFPALPLEDAERHPYPAPLSEPFWRAYGEPLYAFYYAARMLRQVFDILSGEFREPSSVEKPV